MGPSLLYFVYILPSLAAMKRNIFYIVKLQQTTDIIFMLLDFFVFII